MLSHRGPDDKGTFVDEGIGLANTRLSIVDLKDGHQPLSNEDGEVWVTFNGEIFNCGELRAILERKGHAFRTRSDTEVLVHLYEDKGPDFVSELNGMFAFAIWDRRTRTVLLARDYAGMKPLYYSVDQHETLFFASEMKALVPHLGHLTLDMDSLADYLLLGYIPDEHTLLNGLYKLRPGHLVLVNDSGRKVFKYNEFSAATSRFSRTVTASLLLTEIENATKRWLMADVPVAAYISGGLDSSVLAALAAKYGNDSLQTYTAWFGPEYPNELPSASFMAEYLNVNHTPVEVSESDVLDELPNIAWFYDEPIAEAAVIPTYFVSREAARRVKVVLAGEGADELFSGYPWHKLFRAFGIFPAGIDRTHPNSFPRMNYIERYAASMIPYLPLAQRYLLFHAIFTPSSIEKMFPTTSHARAIRVFGEFLTADRGSRLSRVLLCDMMTLLAESFLMKADKGSMANSVEERTPYLDKLLIEFALQIPDRLKATATQDKAILRRASTEILPRATSRRPKRGYGTPYAGWLRHEIGAYFENLIEMSEILKRSSNHFAWSSARRAVRPKQFWTLGCLALWEENLQERSGVPIEIPPPTRWSSERRLR